MGTYSIQQVLQYTHRYYADRIQNRAKEQSRLSHFEFYKIINHRRYAVDDAVQPQLGEKVLYRIIATVKPRYEVVTINGYVG